MAAKSATRGIVVRGFYQESTATSPPPTVGHCSDYLSYALSQLPPRGETYRSWQGNPDNFKGVLYGDDIGINVVAIIIVRGYAKPGHTPYPYSLEPPCPNLTSRHHPLCEVNGSAQCPRGQSTLLDRTTHVATWKRLSIIVLDIEKVSGIHFIYSDGNKQSVRYSEYTKCTVYTKCIGIHNA